MGQAVNEGTITLADGRRMPLADYIGEITDAEERKLMREQRVVAEEAGRFSRCIRRPVTSGVMVDGRVYRPGVVFVAPSYRVKTENLRRRGCGMQVDEKVYNMKAFKLFEALFLNPKVWLSSRRLSELTGVGISSVSVLLFRSLPFLKAEGLLEEGDDPHSSKGKLYRFIGQCDDPKGEARIWYAKMLASTQSRDKTMRDKKRAAAELSPESRAHLMVSRLPSASASRQPVAAEYKGGNGVVRVDVDTATMEALVRVPLAKLPLVLEVIGGRAGR